MIGAYVQNLTEIFINGQNHGMKLSVPVKCTCVSLYINSSSTSGRSVEQLFICSTAYFRAPDTALPYKTQGCTILQLF